MTALDPRVEAALDAWYGGEDWRSIMADYLDKTRSEMAFALAAADAARLGLSEEDRNRACDVMAIARLSPEPGSRVYLTERDKHFARAMLSALLTEFTVTRK